MSKKLIIMMAAAGLVSFGGAFVFGWLTKHPPDKSIANAPGQPGPTGSIAAGIGTPEPPEQHTGIRSAIGADEDWMKRSMTEKQLKALVYEVRENIREYNNKLQGLEVLEHRVQVAQDTLKKDIENLNNLRVELASMVASLQSERDKLINSRVKIAEAEKANLMSIAAAYDKMDVSSASKILTNICVMGDSQGQRKGYEGRGAGTDDAVKILYYMTERTKAKLLAELVNSEPKLAAVLCQRLKHIVEEK
ncbi:MAG TPA: hypothetical protein VMW16_00395 [Sedimentisphaerales bacterium]|nr:hypothetical protein [Sedimentisphaerales bacterium]